MHKKVTRFAGLDRCATANLQPELDSAENGYYDFQPTSVAQALRPLEAENAELRAKAVQLALQIQLLRDRRGRRASA